VSEHPRKHYSDGFSDEKRLNALDNHIRGCQPPEQNAHQDESHTYFKRAMSLEFSKDPLGDAIKQSLIPIPSDDATADQLTICWLTNDEYGQEAETKSRMVQRYMQRQDKDSISIADQHNHAVDLSLVPPGKSKVEGVHDWSLLSLDMWQAPDETDSESLKRLDAFNKAKEQQLRDTIFIIDVRIFP
jgi:hypothetical protein